MSSKVKNRMKSTLGNEPKFCWCQIYLYKFLLILG